MRKSPSEIGKVTGIDLDLLVAAWRRLYPSKTALHVAGRLGANPRTVEGWLEGTSAPSFDYGSRIIDAFGPGFLCEVMTDPPEWLRHAARRAEVEALDATIAAATAQLEMLRRGF